MGAQARGSPRFDGFEAAPKTCGGRPALSKVPVGGCPRTLELAACGHWHAASALLGEFWTRFGGALYVVKGDAPEPATSRVPAPPRRQHATTGYAGARDA